jgi:hypothetical protein
MDTLVLSDQVEFSMLTNSQLIRSQWEDSTWVRVDRSGLFQEVVKSGQYSGIKDWGMKKKGTAIDGFKKVDKM